MHAVTFVWGKSGTWRDRQHSNEVLAIMLDALYNIDCSFLRRFP